MRILVVEDEFLVALEIRNILEDLGHDVVGTAPDSQHARAIAALGVDIALVDLNLRDGPTGADVGADLAAQGVTVLFMTANPALLGRHGVPGAVGVIAKPVENREMMQAARYVEALRLGRSPPQPPSRLMAFAA